MGMVRQARRLPLLPRFTRGDHEHICTCYEHATGCNQTAGGGSLRQQPCRQPNQWEDHLLQARNAFTVLDERPWITHLLPWLIAKCNSFGDLYSFLGNFFSTIASALTTATSSPVVTSVFTGCLMSRIPLFMGHLMRRSTISNILGLMEVNVTAMYLSTNPVQHQHKHVEIDLHFVREKVAISMAPNRYREY